MARIGRGSGLGSLLNQAFPGPSPDMANSTSAAYLPTAVLESFIPGYGYLHRFVLYSTGFDVTSLVSYIALLWIAQRIYNSARTAFNSFLHSLWVSEVTINSTDDIHGHLIQFLAHQFETKSSRKLLAETPAKTAWQVDSEMTEALETTTDADGNTKWLNFSNQEAKSLPRFTPALGSSHSFWHRGTYFTLKRKEVPFMDTLGGGAATFKDKETLTLSCYGRSTEPIKKLIQHAKDHHHLGHNVKTIIKRPSPKDMRRYGGRWMTIAQRPCRPMNTVVLDEMRKMDVLTDINEYLNPATARWYANRGIPYRRGYLFYGPPGTGKTSLTFALAGVFGLDIHVISLLEPTLTEEELGMLFTNLPARCIVLLEDIDSAGLVRPEKAAEENAPPPDTSKDEWNMVNFAKAIKKVSSQSVEKTEGITLSGLLNIIDGVASHEGRVLVMTTNHPEQLDEALIRPGRVDHQVAFSNATQSQISEIFERMYSIDLAPTATLPLAQQSTPSSTLTPPATPTKSVGGVETDELAEIAQKFASCIPDGMCSPAEIQGFLLKRKKDPRKALREVEGWVEGMREQREMKTKLVRVQ
ncbi:mitochondrial chaperone BCS1 [Phlyctema vagabunda]|uniref:Mitochondrial chaperone BCS1 n=1 Tax=Phlyctema vagabunda TaxID=108571 RepID=A0ABR4PHX1_9HELO